jgi:hypothetical protein
MMKLAIQMVRGLARSYFNALETLDVRHASHYVEDVPHSTNPV